MTSRIGAAHERVFEAGFEDWNEKDVDTLARLMRKFADAMREGQQGDA